MREALRDEPALAVAGDVVEQDQASELHRLDGRAGQDVGDHPVVRRHGEDGDADERAPPVQPEPEARGGEGARVVVREDERLGGPVGEDGGHLVGPRVDDRSGGHVGAALVAPAQPDSRDHRLLRAGGGGSMSTPAATTIPSRPVKSARACFAEPGRVRGGAASCSQGRNWRGTPHGRLPGGGCFGVVMGGAALSPTRSGWAG